MLGTPWLSRSCVQPATGLGPSPSGRRCGRRTGGRRTLLAWWRVRRPLTRRRCRLLRGGFVVLRRIRETVAASRAAGFGPSELPPAKGVTGPGGARLGSPTRLALFPPTTLPRPTSPFPHPFPLPSGRGLVSSLRAALRPAVKVKPANSAAARTAVDDKLFRIRDPKQLGQAVRKLVPWEEAHTYCVGPRTAGARSWMLRAFRAYVAEAPTLPVDHAVVKFLWSRLEGVSLLTVAGYCGSPLRLWRKGSWGHAPNGCWRHDGRSRSSARFYVSARRLQWTPQQCRAR